MEAAAEPLLRQFAQKHELYLDKPGGRAARRGTKVRWVDSQGNTHDLDYVMESGGTDDKIGDPVAFIEIAWRRYAKHSRAKVQEIEGAVVPLLSRYKDVAPFAGAILAGVFTNKAVEQLRSRRFSILHFPLETVVEAFGSVGVDVAYDEKTPHAELEDKVRAWESLSEAQRGRVADLLVQIDSEEVQSFMQDLEVVVTRQIEVVRVVPLHGSTAEWLSVGQAIDFIRGYDESGSLQPFVKYEIEVRYRNGDRIDGIFHEKERAIAFLLAHVPPSQRPDR